MSTRDARLIIQIQVSEALYAEIDRAVDHYNTRTTLRLTRNAWAAQTLASAASRELQEKHDDGNKSTQGM